MPRMIQAQLDVLAGPCVSRALRIIFWHHAREQPVLLLADVRTRWLRLRVGVIQGRWLQVRPRSGKDLDGRRVEHGAPRCEPRTQHKLIENAEQPRLQDQYLPLRASPASQVSSVLPAPRAHRTRKNAPPDVHANTKKPPGPADTSNFLHKFPKKS